MLPLNLWSEVWTLVSRVEEAMLKGESSELTVGKVAHRKLGPAGRCHRPGALGLGAGTPLGFGSRRRLMGRLLKGRSWLGKGPSRMSALR